MGASVSVGVGDGSCTGASVNGTTVGCAPPPPPTTPSVTVSTGDVGPVPGQSVTLPVGIGGFIGLGGLGIGLRTRRSRSKRSGSSKA